MGDRYVLVTIADNSITNYGNGVTITPLADDVITMAKKTSTDLKESLDHYIWNITTQKVDRLTQAAIDVIENNKKIRKTQRINKYAAIRNKVDTWFHDIDEVTMNNKIDAITTIAEFKKFLKVLSYIVLTLRGYDD